MPARHLPRAVPRRPLHAAHGKPVVADLTKPVSEAIVPVQSANQGSNGISRKPTSASATPRPQRRQGSGGRTTIRDLAEYLDLSKGTVSRALNGYPDISSETQKRVAEAARLFEYRASTPARAIRTGRSESIGLVLNVDEDNAYKPFLSDFLDGISRRLGEQGWVLCVATSFSPEESLEAHSRLVAENKVDGFILPRTKINDGRVELLRKLGAPFVLYGRTGRSEGLSWYDIRGERAMEAAVRRFVVQGHRRIAYIGARDDNMFQALRRDGYRLALEAHGIPREAVLETDGAMSEPEGCAAARRLLQSRVPPTAMLCAVDRAALGACRAIRGFGLVAGHDVSVIGYDGIPEGAYAQPPLTTFSVDNRQAGYRLADMLIRRIGGEPAETLRHEVDAELIARQSDGPPSMTPEQIATHVARMAQTYPWGDS